MPLNIVIAGAGTGGLVAAIGLAREGHKVVVYERLQEFASVGYSFRLMRNSSRCLNHVGIDLEKIGSVTAAHVQIFIAATGALIREEHENPTENDGERLFTGFVSRVALVQDLTRAAREAGVQIHYGSKVTGVDTSRNALLLEHGEDVIGDVILGADGIYSPIRRSFVTGHRAQPKGTGNQNAIRFMVPTSEILQNPEIASLVDSPGASSMWFASDRRVISYPIDFGNTVSVASAYPAALSDNLTHEQDADTAVGYNQKVALETVLDIHSNFEPKVQSLLKMADPEGFRVWKLQDLDDIGTWTSGRTTLVGDACHACLPSAFSGAAMAIEDGVVLSVLLNSKTQIADIEDRLKLYEAFRKPRTSRVRDFGRRMEQTVQSEADLKSYLEFVDEYDAMKAAEEALAKHTTSRE